MPNIHAEMVHLPGFKPPKPPPFKRPNRMGAKAKNLFGNATSTRARNPHTGDKIGSNKYRAPEGLGFAEQEARTSILTNAAITGGSAGLLGGAGAGAAAAHRRSKKKYPDAQKFGKAKVYKITELGSAASKLKQPRWPGLKPVKYATVGAAAVGAPLGYRAKMQDAKDRQDLYRKKQKMAGLSKRLNATPQERHKALVWNSDFTNKGPYNKQERRVAAKIQSKEQLKGQGKGALAGGALGTAAGIGAAAASRGRITPKQGAIGGGFLGAFAGQQRGDYVGRVKGQRKYKTALGKSASVSAFGIEH